ncbi:hypothetical protein HYG86_02130 [Alkalicella caledoniensis]|uniref:Glutaredoxin n=1 Tax=Alkalicella caledoniensis TaxID=2731377 RepID=A0A7G9W4N7_ALKCA|nr:hypothetical protein [Alkalicella caledoniensis]QNO13649.1 hypothetical protein HYG86_02130 [Alkalicella caledoniensis]
MNSIKEKLTKDFAGKANIEFVDIFSDDVQEYSEILKMVDSGLVTLPITLVNNLPRFHGGLNYDDIKELLESRQ